MSEEACGVEVREMTMADIDGVMEIEHASFALPWSRDSFVREMTINKAARYYVLTANGIPLAYAGAWIVIDEGHVTNVAVRPDARGRGYGEKIMRELMRGCAEEGVTWMTLEVRRSNLVAQALYCKLGFVKAGFRKRYYEDNQEDALIMVCEDVPSALAAALT